jgi:hypothetical protein
MLWMPGQVESEVAEHGKLSGVLRELGNPACRCAGSE